MKDIEIWRTPIYKGEIYDNYQVSNFGRILSLNYNHTGKPNLLKPTKNKDGYLNVELHKDGKRKTFKVHRLVAETFLPNLENKPCINHKIEGDEGKTINIVFFNEDGSIDEERTTIEWCTHEYNNTYGTRIERVAKKKQQTEKSQKKYFNLLLMVSLFENGNQQWNVVETDLIEVMLLIVVEENEKHTKDFVGCINKKLSFPTKSVFEIF